MTARGRSMAFLAALLVAPAARAQLYNPAEVHVRRGVPLLKDIPLIGMLFRSDNIVKQNRELIIFVTPRLLTDMANK